MSTKDASTPSRCHQRMQETRLSMVPPQQGRIGSSGWRIPEPRERITDRVLKKLESRTEELKNEGDAKTHEHGQGGSPALFADDEHFRTGRSFGVLEGAVLFDDERPPQGNHQKLPRYRPDGKPPSRGLMRPSGSSSSMSVQAGDADAEGDRSAGRSQPPASMLFWRWPAERQFGENAKERDREHRDRDGSRHGHADFGKPGRASSCRRRCRHD